MPSQKTKTQSSGSWGLGFSVRNREAQNLKFLGSLGLTVRGRKESQGLQGAKVSIAGADLPKSDRFCGLGFMT